MNATLGHGSRIEEVLVTGSLTLVTIGLLSCDFIGSDLKSEILGRIVVMSNQTSKL